MHQTIGAVRSGCGSVFELLLIHNRIVPISLFVWVFKFSRHIFQRQVRDYVRFIEMAQRKLVSTSLANLKENPSKFCPQDGSVAPFVQFPAVLTAAQTLLGVGEGHIVTVSRPRPSHISFACLGDGLAQQRSEPCVQTAGRRRTVSSAQGSEIHWVC